MSNPLTSLERTLAQTGPILLDFDGPICGIFAGYPAPVVASELREILANLGAQGLEELDAEKDPLAVLMWTGSLRQPELTQAVEDALCRAELRAVESASPTPYARETIVAARQSGRAVAVVSNNSAPAVNRYLAHHRLADHVVAVIGRAYLQPERMKPNPEPILQGVKAVGAEAESCVLVGDSLTDITGSRAAGVRVIGYANKPAKAALFSAARADAVVTSMSQLATTLLQGVAE